MFPRFFLPNNEAVENIRTIIIEAERRLPRRQCFLITLRGDIRMNESRLRVCAIVIESLTDARETERSITSHYNGGLIAKTCNIPCQGILFRLFVISIYADIYFWIAHYMREK